MKKARWLLIIPCFLFAISGLVSGVFAQSLQRALVLPPDHPAATIPAGAIPMPTMPTPTAKTLRILAQDTCQRPDQALWGKASDGQSWGGDANAQAQRAGFTSAGRDFSLLARRPDRCRGFAFALEIPLTSVTVVDDLDEKPRN